MATKTVAQELASRIQAVRNCEKSGNAEWEAEHRRVADLLADDFLPSGSGCDNGTVIDWDSSTGERLVFIVQYHHMDEGGSYDGWTEHEIEVTPDWDGVSIHVGGRNRNDIKEYLSDVFHECLSTPVVWDGTTTMGEGRYIRPL